MAYDLNATTAYIREAARRRGIDPDIAVRVARSEGLARGTWQSNLSKNGRREPSYGPFQLLVGGEGTAYPAGMGNDFKRATGLDPADPRNVNATIDYALDRAAKDGWGAWYGAAKVGVGRRDGIGGAKPVGPGARPAGGSPLVDAVASRGEGSGTVVGGAGNDTVAPGSPTAPTVNIGLPSERKSKSAEAMIKAGYDLGGNAKNGWDAIGGLAQVLAGNMAANRAEAGEQSALQKALAGLDPEYAMAAQLIGGREGAAQAILSQQENRTATARRREDQAWRQDERDYQRRQDVQQNERADRAEQRATAAAANDGVPSGYRWNADRTSYEAIPGGPADPATRAAAGFRTLTPDEVAQRGLPPGSYQIGPDGKLDEVGKSGQTINVSSGRDEGEFAKKAAGKMADRFGTLADGGSAAANVLQTLPQMRELLTIAPQGPIQGRLAELFPGFSTAADAFTAGINQIAPSLRIPGSGAQSDKDMDILLGSFPRMRNDPQANILIMDAMQTKAQINLQRAEIANAALRGELEPAEADRRLSELDRTSIIPEGLRQRLGVTQPPETGMSSNPTNRPRATNPQTGEVIEFDGTQWIPAK